MTVIAWIKPKDPAGDDTILSHGAYAADGYFLGLYNATNPQLVVLTRQTYGTGNTIVDDAWQMVGATFTNTAAILYYNGVTTTQATNGTYTLNATARTLYLGQSDAGTGFWDGDMGDAWIYNRVLSAGEMLHIYNSTKWRYQ